MKKLLYICTLCVALFSCQQEDLFQYSGEGLSSVQLSIESQSNTEISRAVSSDEDEKLIQNIYVFIFNEDGSIASKNYQIVGAHQSTTVNMKDVPSGIKDVVVVANFDNAMVSLTKTNLDAIENKKELMALTSSISGDFTERGINFLMSGTATTTLVAGKTHTVKIGLDRVDAKICFNITTKAGVTFTPLDWRLVSAPKNVAVISSNKSDLFDDTTDNYFNSKRNNFAVSETEGVNTFAFYAMENKITAKDIIPNTGTYNEQYAQREKQIKADNGDGTVTNGLFEYAQERATYVEIRGNIFYEISEGDERSADVKYIVHLGAVNGVNDYNNLRNTSYTYKVLINGASDIVVEVTDNNEKRPGAEGDVVNAKVIKELDSPNQIITLKFHESNIDENLTWNISTPFSAGSEEENPEDYKWIHFAVDNIVNSDHYEQGFMLYKGDTKVYTEAEFWDKNYLHPLDKYIEDIKSTDPNSGEKILDLKQLIEILKECKRRSLKNNTNTIFDKTKHIQFTAYVKEFYYDINPTDPSETVENGLWKKFVNHKKRVINILSNLTYSADGQSTMSNALYSIRQASIQTMYNKFSTDNFTAWGSQMIQDKTMTTFEKIATKGKDLTYSDKINGRNNSVLMWKILDDTKKWSYYINQKMWIMNTDYESAKYKCLKLNRDNNGNGNIDTDEVQWYLSSINQLTDMWIGENSYDNNSRLYTETNWVPGTKEWFASSTVQEREYSSGFLTPIYKDHPIILWSSEGSSIGKIEQLSDKVYYRCVRNLGLAKNAPINTVPDDFAHYDHTTKILSLDKLDTKSLRGFPTIEELSQHHERSAENKPWKAFQIAVKTSEEEGKGKNWLWSEVQTKSEPLLPQKDRICPSGWRVPNQRELALIYTRVTKEWSGMWSLPNHFTRTHFSFSKKAGGDTFNRRPGFSVTTSGGVYYLINNSGDKGGVRCVRDVIK